MSTEKIARILRCKDNHPTMQKYVKLAELADELGISLYFSAGRCIINDRDRDDSLPTLYLEDIEESQSVYHFPYEFEYKMIYDNPVYLEEQKKESIERARKREIEEKRKLAETAARKAEEERRKAEELERKERALLVDLKRKYES